MINRENLVKIGRAGGKTSNRETPDQIGRVGISVSITLAGEVKPLLDPYRQRNASPTVLMIGPASVQVT